jgi:hypothetical protein
MVKDMAVFVKTSQAAPVREVTWSEFLKKTLASGYMLGM